MSTDEIIEIDGVKCRVWRGKTVNGIECAVFVHRIEVADGEHERFAADLGEMPAPANYVPGSARVWSGT